MRLCICTPQLPYPPEQGAALRNYYLLRHAARTHDVTLVSFAAPGAPVHDTLRALCADVLVGPPRPRPMARRLAELMLAEPDLARRLRSPALESRVRRHCARCGPFDAVQVEGLEMLPLARAVAARRLILDEHNAELVLQRSAARSDAALRRWPQALYSLFQAAKLRRYEAAACRAASVVTAASEADARILRRLAPGTPVGVVPNGVDTDLYAPSARDERAAGQPPTLLFAGKMDFRPNVEAMLWFVRSVLPIIWATILDARLVVFGMRPPPSIRALAADRRVEVTGYVPGVEGERRYLAAADVCVAPLLSGSGTKLKVLTAMSMAKPIVATPQGASGLDVDDGVHLCIASSPRAFAERVIRVLGDPGLRRRMGAAARRRAIERYDWRVIGERMERLAYG